MEAGDRDLLNPNIMHDRVVANENLARVLATQHCH